MSDTHAQLLKGNVVRGKVVNVSLFEEQGLGVFLTKLRAQGWLDLFANTQQGVLCLSWLNSMPTVLSPMGW